MSSTPSRASSTRRWRPRRPRSAAAKSPSSRPGRPQERKDYLALIEQTKQLEIENLKERQALQRSDRGAQARGGTGTAISASITRPNGSSRRSRQNGSTKSWKRKTISGRGHRHPEDGKITGSLFMQHTPSRFLKVAKPAGLHHAHPGFTRFMARAPADFPLHRRAPQGVPLCLPRRSPHPRVRALRPARGAHRAGFQSARQAQAPLAVHGSRKEMVRRHRRRTIREGPTTAAPDTSTSAPACGSVPPERFGARPAPSPFACLRRAQQVVSDRAELRLQLLFAEVFDFVSGDERVGHVFLLRLLGRDHRGLDDGDPAARIGSASPAGTNASARSAPALDASRTDARLNDERTCGRGLQGKGKNLPQCEYARNFEDPKKGRSKRQCAVRTDPPLRTSAATPLQSDTNGPDEELQRSPRKAERQRAP